MFMTSEYKCVHGNSQQQILNQPMPKHQYPCPIHYECNPMHRSTIPCLCPSTAAVVAAAGTSRRSSAPGTVSEGVERDGRR